MSAVADALCVSRQHLSSMRNRKDHGRRRGRTPLPDAELVADIRALIIDLPTYGYRRVHALLRRQAEEDGRAAPNPKRVYRVMKVHGLLLQRHSGRGEEHRHDGRIATPATPAGARTGSRSAVTMAKRSASPLRSTAAIAKQ